MTQFISLFQAAVAFGTVILFGAVGEILTEKSGNLNLGVPGIMYLGGIAGLAGTFFYESAVAEPNKLVCLLIALVCALAASALGGLIYSVLTITLRANQNVTGLALTIFGVGFGKFFGEYYRVKAGGRLVISANLDHLFTAKLFPDFLSNIPIIGKLLFSYNFMIYLSIVIAIAMAWMLNRSRVGLNLRSVGEDPATADAAGINVTLYKYLFTCIGGGICGLGGLYFTMVSGSGNWAADAMDGKGWLAVALVIFALWRPLRAVWGSILFGALMIMYMRVTVFPIPTEIYKILPYVVTLIVLIVLSIRQRRENQPPASLGNAYFREER